MYRFVRSAVARSGRGLDAVQFAKEVTAYLNTKYTHYTVHAFSGVFGQAWSLQWHVDVPNLAALEALLAQITADEGYWAIIGKWPDVLMEGSLHDSLVQTL